MGRRTRFFGRAAAVATALLVVSSGVGVTSALPGSRTETSRERVGETVRVVRVHNEIGDVTIAPSGRTVVETSEQWLLARPEVRIDVRGDVLDITASCPDVPLNDCRVDFEITVPATATAIVDVGAGSIELWALSGNHRLETGAGSIDATDIGSRAATIEASTGAGSIDLRDIRARNVETSTGSGDIAVDAAELHNSLLARAGSGDVDVAVPAGAYAVFVETASGRRTVHGITNDPRAQRTITATAGSGSVVVRARGTTPPRELDDDEPSPRKRPDDRDRDDRDDPAEPRPTTTTTSPRSTSTTMKSTDEEADDRRDDDRRDEDRGQETEPAPEDDDERGPGYPLLGS